MLGDVDVVVIGGGQAGLATAYHLRRAGVDHVVLDAQDEPGGAWQSTWPSLRLFSPSAYSSLPGWPMPPHPDAFPPVEHVLAYLRAYEERYDLDVQRPVVVSDVIADDDGLTLHIGATDSEVRAPAISIDRMSRPSWSVPSQWTEPGGRSLSGIDIAAGSNGVHASDSAAAPSATAASAPPAISPAARSSAGPAAASPAASSGSSSDLDDDLDDELD